MGYLEIEQFTLAADVTREAFSALDNEVQAWSYVHRAGLRRRTVAFGGDGAVAVVTLLGAPPPALGLDVPATCDDALADFARAIEPGSYRRSVYEDRG